MRKLDRNRDRNKCPALCRVMLALPVWLTAVVPAHAVNYFVNPTGANGAFTSIQAAINAVSGQTATNRANILVAPGTYTEQVTLSKANVSLIGTGTSASQVVITFNGQAVSGNFNPTFLITSTANNFDVTDITFANSTPDNVVQALAMRTQADRTAFDNCRFIGYQDTLLTDTNARNYFRNCYITGDTDFIYGDATSVFDHCQINSTDGGYLTAARTAKTTAIGFVFLDCTLTKSKDSPLVPNGPANNSTYLGRPWHWYDTTTTMPSVTYIRTKMDTHIRTVGWDPWNQADPIGPNTNPDGTTRYSEFGSMNISGTLLPLQADGDPNGRVSWEDPMTAAQAANYTLSHIFGPASFWNVVGSQPELSGITYVDTRASWDPTAQLALLVPEPSAMALLASAALALFLLRGAFRFRNQPSNASAHMTNRHVARTHRGRVTLITSTPRCK